MSVPDEDPHHPARRVLEGRTVLVVGRGSGIARATVLAARDAGARVVAAGRHPDALTDAYAGVHCVGVESVDVTDEASVAALGERLRTVDHVVSTASARARGKLGDLTPEAVRASLDAKVVGPLLLAKHLGPRIGPGGSIVLFSGASAFTISIGTLAVAITNGAADTLTRSLAVELAPVRVNAISPGTIDSGAWDALGDRRKAEMFAERSSRNPARRIGSAADVASAVLFAMTNTFLTGATIPVDGGEQLVRA